MRSQIISIIVSLFLIYIAACGTPSSTLQPTTTLQPVANTSSNTPAQDYARSINIQKDLLQILEALDQDKNMSADEKAYVDALVKKDETLLRNYKEITANLFDYQKNNIINADPIGKDIVDEFSLIPDLNVIDVIDVEAVKDIYNQLLEAKITSYNAFIDSLDAGVKGKKRGSAFEAWLLIYQEKNTEQFNIVETYTGRLSFIYGEAWLRTSSSGFVKGKGFTTDRWQDFNVVTNRLIDPFAVSCYIENNIEYDEEAEKKINDNIYVPEKKPFQTWKDKNAISTGISRLTSHFLVNGGGYFSGEPENNEDKASFVLDVMDTSITAGVNSHTVSCYTEKGLFQKLDDGLLILNKYSSIAELAKGVYHGDKYTVRDYNGVILKTGYLQ